MTVSTSYAPLSFNGDDATTAFAVTWPFFDSSLVVTLVDSTGVETVKTITTHYTVSGGTDSDGLPATGTVTMLTAPASGETLRITRNTSKVQSSSWTNGGAYQAKTLEATLDKIILIAQETQAGINDGITGDVMQLNTSGATDYWDAEDQIILNVGTSTTADAAVNYQQLSDAVLAAGSWLGTTGATDNAILRANGTGGATIQSSSATIDDSGNISAPNLQAVVASRTAMKALDTTVVATAYLNEGGRSGVFVWDGSDLSTEVAADAQEGLYVSSGDGSSGAWVRQVQGAYDMAWFGLSESNTAADNATAANAAFEYLRNALHGNLASNDEPTVAIMTRPGVYAITSINATEIRSKSWRWDCYGATFECATAGATVVDMLHSRQGLIQGLHVVGDSTTRPRVGLQIGYMETNISASEHVFVNCYIRGQYTLTSVLNNGSESTQFIGCNFRNAYNSASCYGYIADGMNWHGPRSEYLDSTNGNLVAIPVATVSAAATATVTTSEAHGFSVSDKVRFTDVSGSTDVDDADTTWTIASVPTSTTFTITSTNGSAGTGGYVHLVEAQSFVQCSMYDTTIFKDAAGPAIWMTSNVGRHNYRGYVYSYNDDGVVIFFRPSISQNYPQALELDIGFEGNTLSNLIYFYESETATNTYFMADLRLRDHGSQNSAAIFATNATTSTFAFTGAKIDLPKIAGTSINFCDTPARYAFSGHFTMADSGGLDNMPSSNAIVHTRDANDFAYPAGGVDIYATWLNGSAVNYNMHKGPKRFYGSSAALSGELSAEAYSEISRKVVTTAVLTETFSIADDAAASFTLRGTSPSALVAIASSGGTGPNGIYWCRASGSPSVVALTSGGTPATTTTGALAGTTGSDTVFTVSAHTDGKVYLENRIGSALTVTVTVLSEV